nr:hypothetical protein B0A51_04319 [Rachicladosporium sp. CCFEE 5018]
MARKTAPRRCAHSGTQVMPSCHAALAGYKQPDEKTRREHASTGALDFATFQTYVQSSSFPAPLVLPGDALEIERPEVPQSVTECMRWRNAVTPERRTVYVVGPADAADEVEHVRPSARSGSDGSRPAKEQKIDNSRTESVSLDPPKIDNIVEYLRAFYHGLPVRAWHRDDLDFVSWTGDVPKGPRKSSRLRQQCPPFIGLRHGTEVTRIRTRRSPDGHFTAQLSLNDLLDVAIGILPADAYALIMLVHQDMYEDETDDFCCGRAYGGSRVSVVSTARYNPILEEQQDVEREHAWPLSHCKAYVEQKCFLEDGSHAATKDGPSIPSTKHVVNKHAVSDAIEASAQIPTRKSKASLEALWLSRVCKTASHELSHCFGIGHCVYYACVMQSTAHLSEDARQPPYLCPVDMAKVLTATGATEQAWCRAMLAAMSTWRHDERMFAGFCTWLDVRLAEIS